jgi:membrane dipeptidase
MELGLKVKIMERVQKNKPGFPNQPDWFKDARGFENLEKGLKKVGFSQEETNGILGNNWFNFYKNI